MKYLLVLSLLAGCDKTTETIQKQMGSGFRCEHGPNYSALCTKNEQNYVCFMSRKRHSDLVLCLSAVNANETR